MHALIVAMASPTADAVGQQVADTAYQPPIRMRWPQVGPVVAIDEGHTNFHTVADRYALFADLLRRAGYRVRGIG